MRQTLCPDWMSDSISGDVTASIMFLPSRKSQLTYRIEPECLFTVTGRNRGMEQSCVPVPL